MRVLVVSRTAIGRLACVGAIGLDAEMNLRLLDRHGSYLPPDDLRIGDVLDVDFVRPARSTPPHLENVHMTSQEQIGHLEDARHEILTRVEPWRGEIDSLFDGCIHLDTARHLCYVIEGGPVPQGSTGFWFPPTDLDFDGSRYVMQRRGRHLCTIAYVGIDPPAERIRPDTLVRLSLAQWWRGSRDRGPVCYLQISGTFD